MNSNGEPSTEQLRGELEEIVRDAQERRDYDVIVHSKMLHQMLGRECDTEASLEEIVDACDELAADGVLAYLGSDEKWGANYVLASVPDEKIAQFREGFEYDASA